MIKILVRVKGAQLMWMKAKKKAGKIKNVNSYIRDLIDKEIKNDVEGNKRRLREKRGTEIL